MTNGRSSRNDVISAEIYKYGRNHLVHKKFLQDFKDDYIAYLYKTKAINAKH